MGNAGGRTATITAETSVVRKWAALYVSVFIAFAVQKGMLKVIDAATPSDTGLFYDYDGSKLDW
jgi:hypothetical protein